MAVTMAAALLAPVREADAALNTYFAKIQGEKQGHIKGGATQAGREDWIEIVGFSHEVVSPRDSASGMSTGKRTHKPFTMTLDVDLGIIAILIGMFESGEKLEGTLAVGSKKKGKGGKLEYYEIELEDALITSYRIETTPAGDDVLVLEVMPAKIEAKLPDGKLLFSSTAAAPAKKAAPPTK
jgi:type VI secretion system secreted protein Hcp